LQVIARLLLRTLRARSLTRPPRPISPTSHLYDDACPRFRLLHKTAKSTRADWATAFPPRQIWTPPRHCHLPPIVFCFEARPPSAAAASLNLGRPPASPPLHHSAPDRPATTSPPYRHTSCIRHRGWDQAIPVAIAAIPVRLLGAGSVSIHRLDGTLAHLAPSCAVLSTCLYLFCAP